jgi:hypothetical protein
VHYEKVELALGLYCTFGGRPSFEVLLPGEVCNVSDLELELHEPKGNDSEEADDDYD